MRHGKITRRQAIGAVVAVPAAAATSAARNPGIECVWTFGTAVAAAPLPVAAINTLVRDLPGPFALYVGPSICGTMTAAGAQSLLRELGPGWSLLDYSKIADCYTFLRETSGTATSSPRR